MSKTSWPVSRVCHHNNTFSLLFLPPSSFHSSWSLLLFSFLFLFFVSTCFVSFFPVSAPLPTSSSFFMYYIYMYIIYIRRIQQLHKSVYIYAQANGFSAAAEANSHQQLYKLTPPADEEEFFFNYFYFYFIFFQRFFIFARETPRVYFYLFFFFFLSTTTLTTGNIKYDWQLFQFSSVCCVQTL